MKLAIVDINMNARRELEEQLRLDGHVVLGVPNRSNLSGQAPPDLDAVILASRENELATISLLRDIRQGSLDGVDHSIPIVFVGAETDTQQLRAYRAGADQVLSVAASPAVIQAATHNTLVRRSGGALHSDLALRNLTIDRDAHSVKIDGEPVHLSRKEFALLSQLAKAPTRVWTREELLGSVWGDPSADYGRSRTLDSHMSRLTRKLTEAGSHVKPGNRWGVGYTLDGFEEPYPSTSSNELTI